MNGEGGDRADGGTGKGTAGAGAGAGEGAGHEGFARLNVVRLTVTLDRFAFTDRFPLRARAKRY